jgi:hypothetical protein
VSQRTICDLLAQLDYSLRATRKVREGGRHADRDAQFAYVAGRVAQYQNAGKPVISMDTKKKKPIGDFEDAGHEWQPKGKPEAVRVYDFIDQALGKIAPYGVYDISANQGWVSVGITHDTAEFAVETIRRWWRGMGQPLYPTARQLLITADCGASNGCRARLWSPGAEAEPRHRGAGMRRLARSALAQAVPTFSPALPCAGSEMCIRVWAERDPSPSGGARPSVLVAFGRAP